MHVDGSHEGGHYFHGHLVLAGQSHKGHVEVPVYITHVVQFFVLLPPAQQAVKVGQTGTD